MGHLLPGPSSFYAGTDLSVVPSDLMIAKSKGHFSNFIWLDLSAAIIRWTTLSLEVSLYLPITLHPLGFPPLFRPPLFSLPFLCCALPVGTSQGFIVPFSLFVKLYTPLSAYIFSHSFKYNLSCLHIQCKCSYVMLSRFG